VSDVSNGNRNRSVEPVISNLKDLEHSANELCEKALNDAREQLHPLTRNAELDHLDKRVEFVQAFKLALEKRIAQKLAACQPGVQAVFTFEESWMQRPRSWDSSIHLLVKVPRLSNTLKAVGKKLDRSLVKYLKQLSWSRFRTCQSVLEIQQVTPNELRRGISYGAMFCAVHSVPVKVWPQNKRQD
jgi:hypothetical protein